MPLPRYAANRDANEPEIVAALEAAGATVRRLSMPGVPDLLVGIDGLNFLIEVKSATGKLNAEQFDFFETWNGQVDMVRTVEEALKVIGK